VADYIPESHTELTDIGVRTHPQIDQALDNLAASVGAAWDRFTVALNAGHLVGEVVPSVVRINLPVGKTFVGAKVIMGYVDGRLQDPGYGWQIASDDLAIEVYVPTNPAQRARYLAAAVKYDVIWLAG
jgi:hypothetical protein